MAESLCGLTIIDGGPQAIDEGIPERDILTHARRVITGDLRFHVGGAGFTLNWLPARQFHNQVFHLCADNKQMPGAHRGGPVTGTVLEATLGRDQDAFCQAIRGKLGKLTLEFFMDLLESRL